MISLLFDSNIQFQDRNGSILTGGILNVYYEGSSDSTLNPAPTYSDSEGTVENPFDIVLDSNGRATVYVDTDYVYRLEVYDPDRSLLWTTYGISIETGGGTGSNVSITSTDGTVDIDVTTTGSHKIYDLSVENSGSSDHKVAVDSSSTAGYLENVLVSDSDTIDLVKSGNQLRINVNTEINADPKLSTMEEYAINAATSNYGSYALNSGYSNLVWNDTSWASYPWLNAIVYQSTRIATAQGTITKCNVAVCGSVSMSDPPACLCIGVFSIDGTLLGKTGLKYYGTDFTSGSELCSFDIIEETTGSLRLARNTRYIIQAWTCGLQLAGLDRSESYNYTYDYELRQNLQTTISQPVFVEPLQTTMNQASVIPYISFGAAALN